MSDNKKLKGRMNEQLSETNLSAVAGGNDTNGLNMEGQATGLGASIKNDMKLENEMKMDTNAEGNLSLLGDVIKNSVNNSTNVNISGNNSNAQVVNNARIDINN